MKHMRTIYCERTNEQRKKHQNQNKQLHQFKSNLTVTETNMVQKCVWHHTEELTQTQSMQTHKINVKNHLFNFNSLAFVCIFESAVIFHHTVQFGNLRTVNIHKQQDLLKTMSWICIILCRFEWIGSDSHALFMKWKQFWPPSVGKSFQDMRNLRLYLF